MAITRSTSTGWLQDLDSTTLSRSTSTGWVEQTAAGGGAANLTPSLFTDGDTFYSATVSAGAVTITPSLFADGDAFHAATVSLGGALQTLTPTLFADGDTFHAATVAAGAVTLAPTLFSDGDTFYSATVAPGAVTLTPSLFADGDTFYTHSIVVDGGPQTLSPSLFTDGDTFHSATVTPGAVTITPSVYADPDTFHAATVTQAGLQTLTPSLFTNDNTFYSATLTGGEQVAPIVGGGKGTVSIKPTKRQKLIIVEQIDDVEELVEQVKEIIKTEPRKKLAAKVKKPTHSLQESPQAAFDWIGYYQTQLDALRDQQRAESLKQQLARNAQIIQSILEKQDNTAILAAQEAEYARLREEEDFLLLLMAA